MDAGGVAQERAAPRLVEGRPPLHAVAEARGDHGRIVGEPLDGAPRRPPAVVLERLRQVPVVERRQRHQPAPQQAVDHPLVVVEALRVARPAAARLDARPGDREAIRFHAQLLQQRHVVAPAMIVVAGDIAVAAVGDLAGRVRKAIPDRLAAAILIPGALDLVRRCSSAPHKVLGKHELGHTDLAIQIVACAQRTQHPIVPLNSVALSSALHLRLLSAQARHAILMIPYGAGLYKASGMCFCYLSLFMLYKHKK